MANRRCLQLLARHATALISLKQTPPIYAVEFIAPKPNPAIIFPNLQPPWLTLWSQSRRFSSSKSDDSESEMEMEEASDGEAENDEPGSRLDRDYSPEEKEAEAAAIGYKVLDPLQRSDSVFKDYEPVFAVVQVFIC